MDTEKVVKVFSKVWVNVYVRRLLIGIAKLCLFYCAFFIVHFFGFEISGDPMANVWRVMTLLLLAYIFLVILIFSGRKSLQKFMGYTDSKRVFKDIFWVGTSITLLSVLIYLSLCLFLFYSQQLPDNLFLLYVLTLCLFLLTVFISYDIIITRNSELILKGMLKKEKIKKIFEEALIVDNPIILTGEEVGIDHQILIDMDIFYMINKKQMRNMTPDDRIAISIQENILEQYVQWKTLDENDEK